MINRCVLCGGPAGEELAAREMMFGLRHRFSYKRCGECGSLWLANVPDDLSVYYDKRYYSLLPCDRNPAPPPGARQWARVVLGLPGFLGDRLAGHRGFPVYARWFRGLGVSLSSRIADVGCGNGHLVMRMASHGFTNVWGFDPFAENDRESAHAHVRTVGIEGAEGSFDIVMFNHSLEHVPHPVETLRCARDRLAPGGAIIVRVPVAGSFADRHYGSDWVGLDPPRHLSVPSQRGIRAAADAVGLRITRAFFDSLPLQFWGSEMYRRDIPLVDGDAHDNRALRRRARALNRRSDGDMAGFVMRVA